MSVSTADILRVVVKFSAPFASEIQNVFHAKVNGSGSASDANVVSALQTWLGDVYGSIETNISTGLSFVTGVVDIIEFAAGLWDTVYHVGDMTALTGFVPTSAGDPLPPACSALLAFPTIQPGHVGRKYIGGLTEGDVDTDGELTAATVSNLTTAVTQLLAGEVVPSSSLTLEPVVLNIEGGYGQSIAAGVVYPEIAYQRRRKKGSGI